MFLISQTHRREQCGRIIQKLHIRLIGFQSNIGVFAMGQYFWKLQILLSYSDVSGYFLITVLHADFVHEYLLKSLFASPYEVSNALFH